MNSSKQLRKSQVKTRKDIKSARNSALPWEEHRMRNSKRLIEHRKNLRMEKLNEKRMPTHISSLPLEVTQHILSYLSARDRLSCSLVCKQWLHAMDDPSLVDDVWLRLNSADLNRIQGWKHKIPAPFTRSFVNVELCQIHITASTCWFLEDYGEKVKRLILNRCQISKLIEEERCDEEVFLRCAAVNYPNLIYLKFIKNFNRFFLILPKVKVICLEKCATDWALIQLTHRTPHLEVLDLVFVQHRFDAIPNECDFNLMHSNPSKMFISISMLHCYMYCCRQTLTTVKMSHPCFKLKVEKLEKSIQVTGLRLNIISVPDFRVENITEVFNILKTSVDGIGDTQFTNRTLNMFTKCAISICNFLKIFLLVNFKSNLYSISPV